ncbi:hypothetical protein Dimus_024187 [Dionaea muscipula]
MVIEDERHSDLEAWTPLLLEPRVGTSNEAGDPEVLGAWLSARKWVLRDREANAKPKNDLVEHLWNLRGGLEDVGAFSETNLDFTFYLAKEPGTKKLKNHEDSVPITWYKEPGTKKLKNLDFTFSKTNLEQSLRTITWLKNINTNYLAKEVKVSASLKFETNSLNTN